MSRNAYTEGTWKSDPWFRSLCQAIATCKGPEEIAAFLRDVGTLSELKAWAERWEIAKKLATGETYREITYDTGASTTTVTRVAQYLFDGEGGYRRALSRIKPSRMSSKGHHHTSAPRGERMVSMSR